VASPANIELSRKKVARVQHSITLALLARKPVTKFRHYIIWSKASWLNIWTESQSPPPLHWPNFKLIPSIGGNVTCSDVNPTDIAVISRLNDIWPIDFWPNDVVSIVWWRRHLMEQSVGRLLFCRQVAFESVQLLQRLNYFDSSLKKNIFQNRTDLVTCLRL